MIASSSLIRLGGREIHAFHGSLRSVSHAIIKLDVYQVIGGQLNK
jgi:hypothetical protein